MKKIVACTIVLLLCCSLAHAGWRRGSGWGDGTLHMDKNLIAGDSTDGLKFDPDNDGTADIIMTATGSLTGASAFTISGSVTTSPVLLIDANGTTGTTGESSVRIDSENTDVAALYITSAVDGSGTSSTYDDYALAVVSEGIGGVANFYRNTTNPNQHLVKIHEDNVTSGAVRSLYVQADADATATSEAVLFATTNAAFDQPVLKITQAGTAANAILVDSSTSVAKPAIAFGDGDSGFYESVDDTIRGSIAGAARFQLDADGISMAASAKPALLYVTSAANVPSIVPNQGDTNTGIGYFGADNVSIVSGGAEALRVEDPADLAATETSLWLYDLDNGIIQQVSVGADDSGGVGFKVLRTAN